MLQKDADEIERTQDSDLFTNAIKGEQCQLSFHIHLFICLV